MQDQKGNPVSAIPAEKIKEALVQSNLGNPVENICNITSEVFTHIGAVNNRTMVDLEWVAAFTTLQHFFNFNVLLLRELE